MYKSPIEVKIQQMQELYATTLEDGTVQYCRNIGIEVDKDELAKALKYDRDQYEKGYKDAIEEYRHKTQQALHELIPPIGADDMLYLTVCNLLADRLGLPRGDENSYPI